MADVPVLKSSFSTHIQHTINYLRYIDQQNPLFTTGGDANVEQAIDRTIKANAQCYWLQIFSLSEDDCSRLAIDRDYMKNLVTAKRDEIARIYNITPKNLTVYASFHEKDHHPHMHMVFFSSDPNEGFVRGTTAEKYKGLTDASAKLKSKFANEIFKGEAHDIMVAKTQTRNQLNEQLRTLAREVTAPTHPIDTNTREQMLALQAALKEQPGKMTYGYLPSDKKALVNDLLKTVVQHDPVVAQMYETLKQQQFELTRRYASDESVLSEKLDKWEKEFFEPVKGGDASRHNIIIKAALQVDAVGQGSEAGSKKNKEASTAYRPKSSQEAIQSMLYAVSSNLKNEIVNDAMQEQQARRAQKQQRFKKRRNIVVQPRESHLDR